MKAKTSGKFMPAFLALLFVQLCTATESAAENKEGANASVAIWEHPTSALATLQKAHAVDDNSLLMQEDLDFLIAEDGGGACATAAGINVLQTLRVMAGLDPLPNLHRAALAAFEKQPHLLKGRVTNDGFANLIAYCQTRLEAWTVAVETESAPNSKYAEGGKRWSELKGPDLGVEPRQLKVVSFTVTEGTKVLGRHFVLLKGWKENEIVVVDPQKPGKDRHYILEYKSEDKGAAVRIFLLQPADAPARPNARVFELNTLFTMSLREAAEPQSGPMSLEFVKGKIDETAIALRGSSDFLSPRVWRQKTASFGLPGLDLPVEYGGSAWPASKILEIFRHAGKHNLNFRDIVGGAHVRPLLNSKQPEILDIVRQVADGKAYIAIAITEPSAGSDIPSIKSSSRKVEGGYRLTGTKRFNARLDQATHVILFTQGTTGEKGKLSVFVVPIATPGLKVETLAAHGLSGNSYGGLTFTDLFVPDSHLIGRDGDGMQIFFNHFLYWRLMQTAAAIGTGQKALEKMAERIKTREAFGGPIGRFTHLQQPIGQYTTQLDMAYSLAKEAAKMIDRGEYREARAMICGLKAEGVEISLSATDAAARAFGGEGYSTLVDIGDRLRDLNGLRIADGTTDVMRMEVVRHTFGQEFWEMAVQARD
jgi:alkylation response protein AidB-like acyl-CoA dehydrogenase